MSETIPLRVLEAMMYAVNNSAAGGDVNGMVAGLRVAEQMGWKLVPRCPDKRMVRAACKAMSPGKRPTPDRVSNARKHAIRWNAMMDAAPPIQHELLDETPQSAAA